MKKTLYAMLLAVSLLVGFLTDFFGLLGFFSGPDLSGFYKIESVQTPPDARELLRDGAHIDWVTNALEKLAEDNQTTDRLIQRLVSSHDTLQASNRFFRLSHERCVIEVQNLGNEVASDVHLAVGAMVRGEAFRTRQSWAPYNLEDARPTNNFQLGTIEPGRSIRVHLWFDERSLPFLDQEPVVYSGKHTAQLKPVREVYGPVAEFTYTITQSGRPFVAFMASCFLAAVFLAVWYLVSHEYLSFPRLNKKAQEKKNANPKQSRGAARRRNQAVSTDTRERQGAGSE